MSENSKIEWCDHTFNPWEGCQKIGRGCDNCYAEARNARFGGGIAVNWGHGAPRRRTSPANWRKPLAWNAAHADFFSTHGRRQRVFCASLADVFDNAIPTRWRQDLMSLIARTPNLDWLLLTKRIGNAARMLEDSSQHDGLLMDASDHYRPLPNVWIGATVVNQEEADRDIPKLLDTPARIRFLSMEPLLGPVNLRLPTRIWTNSAGGATCDHCCNGDRCDDPTHYERGRPDWRVRCPHCRGTGNGKPIDWVIVGSESGPGARPMHPQWARDIRDQCKAAGVPFLFKQWGEWAPGENTAERRTGIVKTADWFDGRWMFGDTDLARDGGHIDDEPDVYRVGKKYSGRHLDGRTHDEFPEVR